MDRTLRRTPLLIAIAVATGAAAQMPKEGTYDTVNCWSGVSNTIEFSKTHSARSYEMTGSIRSNTPGGMFDNVAFRCVGTSQSFDGKSAATNVCEGIDKDGDKYLSYFSNQGGNVVRAEVAGTGKYAGLERTTAVQALGPFPVVKPGTFQGCNRQTGTYKMK